MITYTISQAEHKFRVLQNDQPGILLVGTDIFNSSNPWHMWMGEVYLNAVHFVGEYWAFVVVSVLINMPTICV